VIAKFRNRARFLCLTAAGFLAVSGVFAQQNPKVVGKLSDIGSNLNDFAVHNGGRLNITADMGSNWSDIYIGELIHFPPHYGFGFSLAMNGIKAVHLNNLLDDTLGISKMTPIFADKQFFPTYLVEMRIGGFRGAPFDVGIKAGFLPAIPIPPVFSDFKYFNMQFGGDFRWCLINSIWSGFRLSLGLAANYLDGYIDYEGYRTQWSDVGQGGSAAWTLDPAGSTMRIGWNTISFNLRLMFQKTFRGSGITLFGSVMAGYGITNTKIGFIGDAIEAGGSGSISRIMDMNGAEMKQVENSLKSFVGNNSTWIIGNTDGKFSVMGTIPYGAIDLHSYEGIAFDFDNDWHVQLALVFDLWSLEYGLSMGFRWQKRHF
jgi:hypothetical protein